MEGFKLRLFEEQDWLSEKVNKIEKFMISEDFHKLNFKLKWFTKLQSYHMHHYFSCLKKRIAELCTIDDVEEYANMVYQKELDAAKTKTEKITKTPKRKSNKKEKKND